ncbi:MAG TPA: ABC transporter permease subunit, partial [Solirubrobacteraceae bacterium]|nr:ABC transporter permease subunit [Solirubrobacteraceae bacterium]
MSAIHALRPGEAIPGATPRRHGGVWSVYRAERRKLGTQLPTRLLALICVLGPFAFAGVLKIQTGSPADTLFGVWVHQSGFALSLVVLSFCGAWGFPVLAGILAGDIFASEDRYGTWKMVLTRSSTRRSLFAGKLLAAMTFSAGLLVLLAISSLAAGLLLVGDGALVDLGGRTLSTGHSLLLVLAAWLLNLLPMLAFTSLAVLLSIVSRNGIVGVVGPALVDLVMQLLLLVGSGVWLHMLLAASAFQGWYAL